MEIKISKTAKECSKCEREFVHDETVTSLARPHEGEFIREDYCGDCAAAGLPKNAYCTWTCVFYDPKVAEQEPAEVFSPLRRVFYDALESDKRDEIAIAYLGAQLLRRQKVFRLIKESEEGDDGTRVALFSDRIGDRLVEVSDPGLSHQELEDGRQTLMARLAELEAPEEPAEESDDEVSTEASTQEST